MSKRITNKAAIPGGKSAGGTSMPKDFLWGFGAITADIALLQRIQHHRKEKKYMQWFALLRGCRHILLAY